MQWTEIVKFLNDIGVLPLVLLLFAFPIGLLVTLVLMRRLLFKNFSFMTAWNAWLSDHRARTEIEVKLEERIRDLVEEVKNLVGCGLDTRRYFEQVYLQTKADHDVMIRHLRDILLLWKREQIDFDEHTEESKKASPE